MEKNFNLNQNVGMVMNGGEHVQIEGMAFFDNRKYFMFSPDDPKPNQVSSFRTLGIVQQMSDGTVDFTVKGYPRSQSKLIRKVFKNEGINIPKAMRKESREAVQAIMDYLMLG